MHFGWIKQTQAGLSDDPLYYRLFESIRRCLASRSFPQTYFDWSPFLLCLLDSIFFAVIGALAWFIKITKVAPFECAEVFRKHPFLALYFSLFSSMIFLLLCLLPSAALFMLTIWPFDPSPPRYPLRWSHTRSSVSIGALV